MSLEQKLAEVPYIVDRLQADPDFQYGKSYKEITALKCHHLIVFAQREAGILPAHNPLPRQDMDNSQLSELFQYRSFEDVPVGQYFCSREIQPTRSRSKEKKRIFSHGALKYSETHVASMERKFKPIDIIPSLDFFENEIFLTRAALGAVILDSDGNYTFPSELIEQQKKEIQGFWKRRVLGQAIIRA